ncbi:hypothetical protein [Nocardioides sp. GXQ0305]|uniref:hypothetical protein n=1 Tax=Nocardioides sp. GXQ0305 TaxID=3423912 RepID=UPI003D7EB377
MMRWSRVDAWGPLAALVGVGVFLLQGFEGSLTRDVSVYAYAGQQVADGVPPYVQILNRAGPLAHLVPGAGAALGELVGADELLAMRVTMMVLSALALWAAYVLGRDLYGSRLAGVMTSAALLSFQGFVTYATGGPREKTTMVLFMLLALWAVSRRHWPAAGVATALATLSWQGSFVPLTVVVAVAVVALPGGWRPRVTALLRFAVAGLAVALVTVVYFLAVGAFAEFYEGFYAVNAGYTTQRGLLTLLQTPRRLVTGFGWSLTLLVVGVLASLAVSAARFRRLDRDSPGAVAVAALGPGTVSCLLWSLMAFEGWPDAFLFLPFAACGLAGLGHLLVASWRPARAPRVAGLVVGALVVATATTALLSRSHDLVEQRRHNDAVLAVLDDPEVLAISNPAPLVFAEARNPIRYQLFSGGQADYLRATYPRGMRGLARAVKRAHPTVITVYGQPWAWIQPVLQRDYLLLGGGPKPYAWYVSVSQTTSEERAEMQRLLRDTLPDAGASGVRRSVA